MFLKRFLGGAAGAAGAVAVEFAIIAPVMIVLYFGLAEVTQAMMAERRVAHTGSVVGDLVAQSSALTPADISDFFLVGTTIVAPFPTAPLSMRVTSITADANDVAKVDWSQASNMTPMAKGTVVTPPATALVANASVIEADVTYVYTSPVSYVLPAPLTFTNTYYLQPRISTQVTCAAC
jgi:Flp pilus assembly protein TadG